MGEHVVEDHMAIAHLRAHGPGNLRPLALKRAPPPRRRLAGGAHLVHHHVEAAEGERAPPGAHRDRRAHQPALFAQRDLDALVAEPREGYTVPDLAQGDLPG